MKIKYQCDYAIAYDQIFDNTFSLSSESSRDTLTVVTVSLRRGNKNRANITSGLTYLWDSGAAYITIKRKHTRTYESRMRSNKVEYSTASGPYCRTHNFKVKILCLSFLAAI